MTCHRNPSPAHQLRQPVGSNHEGVSNVVEPTGDSGEIIAVPSGFGELAIDRDEGGRN
jgi:hypothetical protein